MDLRNELLKAEIEGFGVATHLAEIRRVREQTALLRQQKLLVYRWGLGCPTPVPAFPVWRQGIPGPVPSGDRPPEVPGASKQPPLFNVLGAFWLQVSGFA